MTEKRFKYTTKGFKDGEYDMTHTDVVGKLNDLYYENLNLKRELSEKKTTLEDIIGLIKTDEVTNSVELKKELYE